MGVDLAHEHESAALPGLVLQLKKAKFSIGGLGTRLSDL